MAQQLQIGKQKQTGHGGGVIIIDDACQQPGNAPSGIRPQLEASDLALRTEEEKPLINPTQQRST